MAKIIVAGGGHGGIAAAALLAQQGFDVTVYEARERENMGYDWTDIFDRKGFTAIGLDLPDAKDFRLKHNMTFYSPSMHYRRKQHVPEEQLEIQMERTVIYDYLIKYAEESGVKFEFGVTAEAPVLLGNRVVGIKTDKGNVYGDLIIDACGADSPVRRNMPDYLGMTKELGTMDKFYVYRAFFERTAEIPADDYNIHLFYKGALGISWVAVEEEHTDVLIGRFEPFGEDVVEETLCSLRKQYPSLGEKLVRGGQFVTIPVRQTNAAMTCNGYAAIGDAAFMTVPLIGSGIANSLKAARILADAVAADENREFSAETLYAYQKNFFKKLGSGLAPIACVKLMLTKITEADVEYLFSSGMINDDDITIGADFTDLSGFLDGIDLASLKAKANGVIKDKKLLKIILGTGAQIASVAAITKLMPAKYDTKALKAWAKKYNACFK